MKILLVDDSPAIIDIYSDLLREEGYQVVTARSALEALKVARAEKPDIGIIDYFLPDGNGAALTQNMLASPDTAHMLISLFSNVDQLRPALDAGAIDMISKSDPSDLFLLRVRALARQVEQWHYQQTMQQMLQARDLDSPMRILLVDDAASIRLMYVELLKEAGFLVESAGTVKEALEVACEFQPEVAIIDYHMPDGTGDELIRRLLSERITHDVMPFILTEKKDVIEQSLSAGAIDVLYKSDPSLVFLNRIRSMERYVRSQRHKVKLVEQLFQHVPVAMVEVAGRYVVQTNPSFEAIFGFMPNPSMELDQLFYRMGLGKVSLTDIEQELASQNRTDGSSPIKSWHFVGRNGISRQLELTITTLPGDQEGVLKRKLLSVSDVTALTDLHRAEAQAKQANLQQRWLSSVLASIPDGILVRDGNGRVQQANPAALKMLGYSEAELIGTEMELLFEDQQQEGLIDRYLKRKDGTTVPISLTIASLDSGDGGEMGGEVVVLHDLEELLSAESAKRANKAKDEFLASMSHELRTPLTTIIGNSEILAESPLNVDQQDLLRAIELSSRRQLALVSDILDLSKIESGKFEINETGYDLDLLIEEITHIFSSQEQGGGVQFRISQEVRYDHQLIGDAQRIGQILINLLGNAFKFTQDGEVRLRVWSEDDLLHLSVEDQGIGMSEEVMSRLFRPFEQADGSISRRFGGTGLGLHISRILAELMKGDIIVKSEEGVGSCFRLSIPLIISDQPVVPRERKRFTSSRRFHGQVLVAEDTPEIQVLIRRLMGLAGVDVVMANNGREAVDRALNSNFNLILMDMQMPEMDGIEATQTLRQLGCGVPIVALTANVMQKHRDQFEAAGCNGFLSKPIDRRDLHLVMEHYLESAGEPEVIEISEEENWIDPEMHEVFLTRAAALKEELQAHLSESSWSEARSAAHAIKGSGATFGYPELGSLGHAVCEALDLGKLEQVPELLRKLLAELEQVLENSAQQ